MNNKIFTFYIGIIIVFTCLEVLSATFFYILNKDIKAYQYYPGRYQKSKDLGYELTPSWELNHDILHEKFNSHGFRSPDVKQIKPENHYRIIITGSSIVYGRTSNEHTISSLLEEKLNELYGKIKTIEVINAGVPGYNSFHIIKQFENKLKNFSPDLIINYQFFTDLSIMEHGNNIALSGTFDNSINMRFKKKWINVIIDKSYFLTMLKIAYRNKSLKQKDIDLPSITQVSSSNKNYINKPNEQLETKEKLTFFKSNMSALANHCNNYNIDLMLCLPISLYKRYNTPTEIAIIDNYDSKDQILEAIGIGNKMLEEVSTANQNVYYFDMSRMIESDISLFDDKYHTLEKGNDIVSEELKNFIVSKQLILK